LFEPWRGFGVTDTVVAFEAPAADFSFVATNGVTVSMWENSSIAYAFVLGRALGVMEIVPEPAQPFPYHSESRWLPEATLVTWAHVHPKPEMLETVGAVGVWEYVTHTNTTEEDGATEDVAIGLAAAG
jgi:hypothetical protein